MNKSKKTTYIALLLFFGTLGYFIVQIFYPQPFTFWNDWHKKDFEHVIKIGNILGSKEELDKKIRCWEATNSRCGIVYTFVTDLDFVNFKTQVESLGFEEIMSRDIDGYGLITAVDFNTSIALEVNNEKDLINIRNNITEPYAWGWRLKNEKDRRVNIDFYQPNPIDIVKLNDKILNGNIVSILLYTRGE